MNEGAHHQKSLKELCTEIREITFKIRNPILKSAICFETINHVIILL